MIDAILLQVRDITRDMTLGAFDALREGMWGLILVAAPIAVIIFAVQGLAGRMSLERVLIWSAKLAMIGAMLANLDYAPHLATLFQAFPDAIAATLIVTPQAGAAPPEGVDAAQWAVNQIYDRISAASTAIFTQAGLLNPAPGIYAIMVYVIGLFMLAIYLVYEVTLTVGLSVSLGLAPLFLAAFLFNVTAPMFQAWLKWVISFGIAKILVASFVGAVLAVAAQVDAGDFTVTVTTSSWIWGERTTVELADGYLIMQRVTPLLLITLCIIILLAQIPNLAASLAGTSAVAIGDGVAQTRRLAAAAASAPRAGAAGLRKVERAGDALNAGVHGARDALRAGASTPAMAKAAVQSGLEMMAKRRAEDQKRGRP